MKDPMKPRDKITQKMSRDGLIEVNETKDTAPSKCSMTRSAAAVSGFAGIAAARGGAAPEDDTGENCCAASCAACCSGVFCKSASCVLLLIRWAVSFVSFTSNAPSRVIFCVILSFGLYCFMLPHLHSAPLQGRNTQCSAQCR